MISLTDIVTRVSPPLPWAEGDNIPWNDPDFSKRMLEEHLSQHHDLASRRLSRIEAQVSWMRQKIAPPPARILDLACGPGLYLGRFAAEGHRGTGIDFSPASIEHARRQAADSGHEIEYRLADLRQAEFGSGFDAVLFLYGQLNVFRREEARAILAKAHRALLPGGVIFVEPQTYDHIATAGQAPPSWSSADSGLFSARPHLLLTESFWDDEARTGTQRFFVVDAATGEVTRHALSNEAYHGDELVDLLNDAGFIDVELLPSLNGVELDDGLCVVTGRRASFAA